MRYQMGSIEPKPTKQGMCWYIRFTGISGNRPRFRIGLVKDYPSKSAASRAANHIREQFNKTPASLERPKTFGDVIARYEREEVSKLNWSTRRKYLNMHSLYIQPRWGNVPLLEVKAQAVRHWLLTLKLASTGEDPATKTQGHIQGRMRDLFKYAMLWEWYPAEINPISLFRIPGSTKRTKKPRVITPDQFNELLKRLDTPRWHAMLFGAYLLGLRVSELFGLQWGDFDWLAEKVWIRRGHVEGHTGKVKTERSESPLPLNPRVAAIFRDWYRSSHFQTETDWVFASEILGGERPLCTKYQQQEYLRPAGEKIGLNFNLGWHTMRHSYKVLLERAGADVTVQRDLMRHSDTHTTMNVYGEVEMDRMRAANDKAVNLALGGK